MESRQEKATVSYRDQQEALVGLADWAKWRKGGWRSSQGSRCSIAALRTERLLELWY